MSKNIEPTLKLISRYLRLEKQETFVVPEYQRGYSWTVTQCDKLWQDIESFISSDATDPYFFGTIIVDCSDPRTFNLIDGQQRTTTFLLLLKALLLQINATLPSMPDDEDTEALKAGLKANQRKIMSILFKAEDEEIPAMLKDHQKTKSIEIFRNNSINEPHHEEIIKIIEAVDFADAEATVHTYRYKRKDNKYTLHFRNFKFFYERLGEKSDSQLNQFAKIFLEKCQVIEIRSWQIEQAITMFNSLNSTGLPLSDSDIISAQLYSKSSDELRAEFNSIWEELQSTTQLLSHRKVIDLDDVLQQYMYIKRAINKEYLKDSSVDVTTPGLRRYYTEINKQLLTEPIYLSTELLIIAKKWEKIKDYSLVKLLLKFNENFKLYLCSYLYRFNLEEITEETVADVALPLLKLFTILELTDLGYSSAKFKTFLFSANIKLVDKNLPIDSIALEFTEHIKKIWTPSFIMEQVTNYDKNILVYLNEFLYCQEQGIVFQMLDNTNVEHIMPSSGRNLDAIRKDAGFESKQEFEETVNKLGNKILLEAVINQAISNDWFKTKKQTSIETRTGYKESRFKMALSLSSYHKDVWQKEDIDAATLRIASRISRFIFV